MRFSPPASLAPSFNLEKEAKLIDFIAHYVGSECLLVARSPQSPVVKALSAISKTLPGAITIRAIFTTLASETDLKDAAAAPVFAGPASYRLLADPRCLDAHEQLVLDGSAVWLGDCMRRDPVKRDAFEIYSAVNDFTARNSRKSFESLWAKAQPVNEQVAVVPRTAGGEFPVLAEAQIEHPLRPRA